MGGSIVDEFIASGRHAVGRAVVVFLLVLYDGAFLDSCHAW